MSRKNFKTRQARIRHRVKYTPAEYSADYIVVMTNGSAVKTVTVTGSRVSAWNYAIRLGVNDNEMFPGKWWPINIARSDANSELLAAV